MTVPVRRKSLPVQIEWKDVSAGTFRAKLSTFNVVDRDMEVTFPEAWPVGKSIVISAYGHKSWDGALPVGKGVLGADTKSGWVDGQFFMDTAHGLDTYRTVKALAEDGLGDWSYGFEVTESSVKSADLAPWPGAMKILKGLNIWEGSPVLVGAGIDTGTESIKSAAYLIAGAPALRARALATHLKAVDELDPATLATIAQIDLLADQLDELVDTVMDQFGIPDEDEIAEGEPEESGKSYSFSEHAKNALAGVTAFVTRAKSLADLRAKKQRKEGRVMSSANRERLAALASGLTTALTDVQDLLTGTDPDSGKSEADAEVHAVWLGLQQRQADSIGA